MYTSAPSTPHLEPSPISNQPLIDTTNLSFSAKQKYYSSLIHSSSSNPRHLWRAVNSLLHLKSPSQLPSSIPSPSIADTYCSFFIPKFHPLATVYSLFWPHNPLVQRDPRVNSGLSICVYSLTVYHE